MCAREINPEKSGKKRAWLKIIDGVSCAEEMVHEQLLFTAAS